MKKISANYIKEILDSLKERSIVNMKKDRFDNVSKFLQAFSFIRYSFHMGYKDDFVESTLLEMSKNIKKCKFKSNNTNNSIVIIDNICADTVGLILQYIDALVDGDFSILYLYKKGFANTPCDDIMSSLKSSHNAIIKQMPLGKSGLALSQWLYDEICNYGSNKLLLHLSEWAIDECVASYALPQEIVRYRISLADHTFWTGAGCIDNIIEFRHYGCNLTLKERGLEKKQILYMPFYPVMKNHPFEGLPLEADGKFLFFSGGALYKVFDKENTFFRLCKAILDICPNSVILFACGKHGDIILSEIIEEYNMQGRFIPIGYRRDICEIFKKCDAYIDTYPFGGGLMCQFAAQYSKPILNFNITNIEEFVSQKAPCHFTLESEDDFISEAYKLYHDDKYRKARGEYMHHAVITKEEFEKDVIETINTNNSLYKIEWNQDFIPLHFSEQDAINFTNESTSLFNFYYKLYQLMGVLMLQLFPLTFFCLQVKRIKNKILRAIK